MEQENKKIVIIIIIAVVVLLLVGGGLYFGLAAAGDKINEDLNSNTATTNENVNTNESSTNSNTNSSSNTNVTINKQVTMTGRVFTKGYGTPSESFGILSSDGLEVGLGDYDSMREQVRPYIGEDITVTYESVCTSSAEGCCRTVFPLCGVVVSWEPVE